MRFRIPPFLPPYAVLVLVITYAVGSLWLGVTRLDAISRLTEDTARGTATVQDLQALLAAVIDIETGGRGFALTADDAYLEPFERGRKRIPGLLSDLRDRMRDDTVALGHVEELVALIAERTTITVSDIERKRSTPDQPYEMVFGRRGKETSEGIRDTVAKLEAREQDKLRQVRGTLGSTMASARVDLYVMAGLTLLLVVSLFMAVRRLRSFMPLATGTLQRRAVDLAPDPAPGGIDDGVGTLLHDALLRARLAAASTPAEAGQDKHRRSLVVALEQALHALSVLRANQPPPAAQGVAHAIATLVDAYSRASGLEIHATIDQSVAVPDDQRAFLVFRSAEWALEAISPRKRSGEVTLAITAGQGAVLLRIDALTDDPTRPLALTPKESEEANALRHGVTAIGGAFTIDEGPTGLSLIVSVPAGD